MIVDLHSVGPLDNLVARKKWPRRSKLNDEAEVQDRPRGTGGRSNIRSQSWNAQ